MMNRIVMLLLVAALFAACDAGSEQQEFPQGDSLPLNFLTTVVDPRTRAELTTNNLTSTGIFAYLTDGDFNQSTATPNFMFNQKLERANNASPWTYSPIKYWPNNTTDKLSFFAYAPYVNETVTGGSNPSFQEKTTAKGFPMLAYTVPSAEANQIDFLASVPLMNQTYKGVSGSIGLAMEHALSRVKFSIKSEMKLKVTALSVNNAPAAATLTFKNDGFSWGNYTGTQTFTATLSGGGTDVAANATDAQPLVTFFLLPNKATATFSVTYLQDGETIAVNKTNVTLPETWTQGGSVNYLLNVTKDGLSVTATLSNEWAGDSSEDEAITSKELAPGYKATDLKLGDYYYSDGTTSDGGYRKYADNTTAVLNIMPVLTDKDGNARSVVAIVFYAGKHSTDTSDYSATGIGQADCHGYAVALRDVGRIAWCNKSGVYNVGTSTSLGDWQGFYNQQQIEAFVAANSADGWAMSNFPAANGCKNYSPAAPATSSGWFLLSSRQLQEIGNGSNKSVLNTSISKAKGNTITEYYVWTSSEDAGDYSRAHHVGVTYNSTGGDYKTASFYVRAILTF